MHLRMWLYPFWRIVSFLVESGIILCGLIQNCLKVRSYHNDSIGQSMMGIFLLTRFKREHQAHEHSSAPWAMRPRLFVGQYVHIHAQQEETKRWTLAGFYSYSDLLNTKFYTTDQK